MSPPVSQANLSSCVLAITLMNTQILGIRFMSMCVKDILLLTSCKMSYFDTQKHTHKHSLDIFTLAHE